MARQQAKKPWHHKASGYWCITIEGNREYLDLDYKVACRKLSEIRKKQQREAAGGTEWLDAPLPRGGFGNLIALPLQKKPRESGNSVFIDQCFSPHADQWALLASLQGISRNAVDELVNSAGQRGPIVGVRMPKMDERDDEPWNAAPSRKSKDLPIKGTLPKTIKLTLGDQIYVSKDNLPPSLRNRILRLAAFQNPEFYKAQAMRLPTFGKPRIVSCAEDYPKHITLPRGCLEGMEALLEGFHIDVEICDERFAGDSIDVTFTGKLRPEQEIAANEMLSHDIGVLSATTAFGKTVIGSSLIAARGVNTLVLVHRRQLMDQWIDRLVEFLGLSKKEIGQFGGGKKN